ncbi:unnamed protein product [Camellia sinensis]
MSWRCAAFGLGGSVGPGDVEDVGEVGDVALDVVNGVEKLVQLIQPDRSERKTELVSRSMLAGVIAATEKFDCLNRFVQLKGLPVLYGWLQDIHKGKIGDGSPKDGGKRKAAVRR